MTKESIITNEVGDDPYLYQPDVLKVMDLWAKHQCIELIQYLRSYAPSGLCSDGEIYSQFIEKQQP